MKRQIWASQVSASPDGKIYSYDITVAKNYLNEDELENLKRLVESFLNVAELRARNHIPTSIAVGRPA